MESFVSLSLNESLLLHIPSYVFWKDTESRFVGCNELFLKDIAGLTKYEDLIGKNDFDLPSEVYATGYIKDDEDVLSKGIIIKRVEKIPLANGKTIISETIKASIKEKGKIIGILGICHDITDSVNAEELRIEIEKHKVIAEEQKKFQGFVEKLLHLINGYQISNLHEKLGVTNKLQSNIKLTKISISPREREVLYYLSLNKSAKEIANILTIIKGKSIASTTVHSLINKSLYAKFEVQNTSQLIEKAKAYKLIPFLIDDD